MSEFKIVKGTKPPRRQSGKKYPFAEMKVGDAFFFSHTEKAKIASAAWHFGRVNRMKFRTGKHTNTQCGCWRVA